MPYVYSTATCSGTYVEYKKDSSKGHGHSEIARKVTINGGHGVATKSLITPQGVVTEVTRDELDFLLKDANFQRHMKAGFMTYSDTKVDPAKRAESMAEKDGSAPLTPADFKKGENGDEVTKIYKGKSKK